MLRNIRRLVGTLNDVLQSLFIVKSPVVYTARRAGASCRLAAARMARCSLDGCIAVHCSPLLIGLELASEKTPASGGGSSPVIRSQLSRDAVAHILGGCTLHIKTRTTLKRERAIQPLRGPYGASVGFNGNCTQGPTNTLCLFCRHSLSVPCLPAALPLRPFGTTSPPTTTTNARADRRHRPRALRAFSSGRLAPALALAAQR